MKRKHYKAKHWWYRHRGQKLYAIACYRLGIVVAHFASAYAAKKAFKATIQRLRLYQEQHKK